MKTAGGRQGLKTIARTIFNAGIKAVDPAGCVDRQLRLAAGDLRVGETVYPLGAAGRIYLIGAGKASAAMARSAERVLGGRIDAGLVITKYDHAVPLQRCRVMEAGHPVPDENGVRATAALLDLVATAGPDDLILCMISGGGSALTPAPAGGIGLADKQETTRLLLACGATIHEINTIRKHLSRIKGGQLCRHANGARIVSLILSDVIGDNLDIIASGATAPDPGTFADCIEILHRHDLSDRIPEPVRRHLFRGDRGQADETPKPGDPVFDRVDNRIVGSISDALRAAENESRRQGFTPLVLSSMIQGEAGDVAKVLCAVAKEVRRSGRPIPAPACLLSGGETTVTIRGDGLGGRNMELALAAGLELSGDHRTLLLSAGTDGTDGPTDAAGAFADGSTVARADALGISAGRCLANNDAYRFFHPLGDLLVTGPTRTNVMDLQIVLVGQ
ncbi:hydroxypyruvate reductase [Desulfosarcina alkanivorans]|uniref:Hydroxypyruvate reductase n=1 Tax=Desulfosarcina alkanivorans TaxID=571177 RepID=A0A5K7YU88_9BACT|nr:glycerate kinase [Desulfosarcina alkanivorans]BBO68247.1 hydroxypyruvate reductase [Desulfosarcina alkanivorans]